MGRPYEASCYLHSCGVKLLRIELAHNLELLIRRWLGHAEMLGKLQGKSGILLELLAAHPRAGRFAGVQAA